MIQSIQVFTLKRNTGGGLIFGQVFQFIRFLKYLKMGFESEYISFYMCFFLKLFREERRAFEVISPICFCLKSIKILVWYQTKKINCSKGLIDCNDSKKVVFEDQVPTNRFLVLLSDQVLPKDGTRDFLLSSFRLILSNTDLQPSIFIYLFSRSFFFQPSGKSIRRNCNFRRKTTRHRDWQVVLNKLNF